MKYLAYLALVATATATNLMNDMPSESHAFDEISSTKYADTGSHMQEESYDANAGIVDDAFLTSPGCWAGINRFTDASNSLETWKKNKDAGKKWEDPTFKADQTSLDWTMYGYPSRYVSPKGLHWVRPGDMGQGLPKNPSYFGSFGKPRPYGVNQGSFGDCWFVAAVAALSQEPRMIERIMSQKTYNENGIFRFRFFVKNKWYGINIDDRLPSYKYGRGYRPYFARMSSAGAWWMPLLEKAFAKLDQNYDRLNGGYSIEAFRTLTGKPSMQIWHRFTTFEKLRSIHGWLIEHNYPMTASCCRDNKKLDGLVKKHVYSLLRIVDLKDPSGKVVHTLAQVRNPWGHEKYHGDWSDYSPLWTDDFKKQANYALVNDGKFFMPYKNYHELFYESAWVVFADFRVQQLDLKIPARKTVIYKFSNPVD